MLRDLDADIVELVAADGWVLDLGLPDVLDDIEKGDVGPDGEPPREEALPRGNVLAIEIEGQLGRASVVEQAIVVFHELHQ